MDLRTEIQTDPEGLGYSGKAPGEIMGILNQPRYNINVPIDLNALHNTIIKARIYERINDAAMDLQAPAHEASVMALELLRNADRVSTMDTSCTAIKDMLDELQASNIITSGHETAISDMASGQESRAERLGLGIVDMNMVYDALR